MNFRLPHSWLLEFLQTPAKPKAIASSLSLCGPSVERLEMIEHEPVYELEVTTNRVDMMSVRGIAREAAAILPRFGFKAALKPLPPAPAIPKILPPTSLKITNDSTLCRRILAIELGQISLKPSPAWLQTRLRQVGLRPLNNAIDITNYAMWAIGHPIHAFDLDKLTATNRLIVRQAKPGETFTTLENLSYTTVGGEVIFDDGTGHIIDLPGIMGTKNTVVSASTKRIYLWIEDVDPVKIRFASMTHALRSQAAILNEKSVDPELALPTLMYAINLYQDLCSAKINSQLVDIYPSPPKIKSVTLDSGLLDTYLGTSLEVATVSGIFTALGCQVQPAATPRPPHRFSLHLTPPSYRAKDLLTPPDFIEEVARIEGYHNLASRVMATPIPLHPSPVQFDLEFQVKQWLAGWGATEVYTYSMISPKLALASGFPLNQHLEIKNPYSAEWVYLRRSLIPSLVAVFAHNPPTSITIFELQHVYHPSPKPRALPQEELHLTLLTSNTYSHLKGLLEALVQKWHLPEPEILTSKTIPAPFAPSQSGRLQLHHDILGYLGAHKSTNNFCLDLDWSVFQKYAKTHPTLKPLLPHPPIIEDLTFTLPPKTPLGPVLTTIKQLDPMIDSVKLSVRYQQNYTFTLTYQDVNRQLATQDLATLRQKIVAALAKTYHAPLVGSLP